MALGIHDVDDPLDEALRRVAVLEETLRWVRSRCSHHRARYEGDGDPGCSGSCVVCRIDEVLGTR